MFKTADTVDNGYESTFYLEIFNILENILLQICNTVICQRNGKNGCKIYHCGSA